MFARIISLLAIKSWLTLTKSSAPYTYISFYIEALVVQPNQKEQKDSAENNAE